MAKRFLLRHDGKSQQRNRACVISTFQVAESNGFQGRLSSVGTRAADRRLIPVSFDPHRNPVSPPTVCGWVFPVIRCFVKYHDEQIERKEKTFEYLTNEIRLILHEDEIIFSDTGRGCFSVLVVGDPGRGGGQKAPSARLERRRPARPF